LILPFSIFSLVASLLSDKQGDGVEESTHIDAHRDGDESIFIDVMYVPERLRRRGVGAACYREWEARLPKDIRYVRLFAADTGSGVNTDGFWASLGFGYQYDAESEDVLTYEDQHMMIKGVNGTKTPEPVYVELEET
jgi:GNAT superfamily N-acetyltransferase